jgi:hypothetical protein
MVRPKAPPFQSGAGRKKVQTPLSFLNFIRIVAAMTKDRISTKTAHGALARRDALAHVSRPLDLLLLTRL